MFMPWTIFQLACFYAVLVWASVMDIRTQQIPPYTYLILLLIGLLNPTAQSAVGFVYTLLPLLITGLIFPDRIGGGDIKFGALCGLILTGTGGLTGLLIGSILCLALAPILCKVMQKPLKGISIPFIPFLSTGCVIASFLPSSLL